MSLSVSVIECPSREHLRNYLCGKLSEENSSSIENHLLECQSCDSVANEIESAQPDTFSGVLRADTEGEELSNENGDDFHRVAGLLNESHADIQRQPSIESHFPMTSIGSYELLEPLGRGGMGAVYLARHRELNKRVAIKLLPALSAQRAEIVNRFRREIRAVGRLEHPTIVRATDAGKIDGTHYLVMEAIDGMDLGRLTRLVGRLAIADACEIARQAAIGLSYAHGEGIVHRDMKPSNLMLNTKGQVKILDFGLAQISLWEEGAAEVTTVGQLMGTLDYMAPEQAERSGAVDYRADIYSLGATLFRLLTGRAPLAATPHLSPLEKLRLLSNHRPPRADLLRDDIPRELVELLNHLLAHEPNARPASAAHVAELLEPFCASENLSQLINEASLKSQRESASEISDAGLKLLNVPSGMKAPTRPPNRNLWHGIKWLAATGLPLVALSGIAFVLEISKGQFVIESDVENVNIKLMKDEKAVQELQIHTGTQTTRLRGGAYEVVLDSASDHISVSKDLFTIRNGETVVATIREKTATEKHTTTRDELPLADRNLVEVGDTLAIYIVGVIPFYPPDGPAADPYVIQAGNHHPVLGMPYVVGPDGSINVPLVGAVSVAGKDIEGARGTLREIYLENRILKEDGTRKLVPQVSMLLKANERVEVRSLFGPGVSSSSGTITPQLSSQERLESVSDDLSMPDRDSVEVGDTLAIYLEEIIPFSVAGETPPAPTVMQAGSHHPVMGSPFTVSPDGSISLPLVGAVPVAGKNTEEIRSAIRDVYLDRQILKESGTRKVVPQVGMLLKANEHLEIRSLFVPGAPASSPAPSRKR